MWKDTQGRGNGLGKAQGHWSILSLGERRWFIETGAHECKEKRVVEEEEG